MAPKERLQANFCLRNRLIDQRLCCSRKEDQVRILVKINLILHRVYGGGSAFNAIGQSKQNVIVLDNLKSVQINDKTATVGVSSNANI